MAFITLQYDLNPGRRPLAVFVAQVAATPLLAGELDMLQMTVFSDTTAAVGAIARRTIVLQTNAQSDAAFPTDALKKDATRSFFIGVLSKRVPSLPVAAEPVVS